MNLREKPFQNIYFIVLSVVVGAVLWVLGEVFKPLCVIGSDSSYCLIGNIWMNVIGILFIISLISVVVFTFLWIYYSIKKRHK